MLFFIVCAALAACTDEEGSIFSPDYGKTPIELSVGGVDAPAMTRAVITDGAGKTLRAFTGQTRLFFAMVAEDGSGNKKYGFNYGTAAAVSNPPVDSKSPVTFPDNYLYWDDAYARDSKVSVYSIAVANKERGNVALTPEGSIVIGTESPGKAIIPFSTTSPGEPTFKWQIGDTDGGSAFKQDQNIFEWADLVFSNNIANYTSSGGSDYRLKFHTDPSDGEMYHKFDKGELKYYHALTQFTIKIKCGDGFKGNGDDFKFTDALGVACTTPNNSFGLKGFYGAEGIFRVGNGEFDAMTDSNLRDYTSIYKVSETHQKASSGEYYLMKAYVFPGTDMTGSKDDAFSFIIDGNKYDISLAMLYDAIKLGQTNVDKLGASPSKVDASILDEVNVGEGGKKLKAGYNYEFTFTVEKSKIKNITAQLVDWETVTADEQTASNARITLNVEDRSGLPKTGEVTSDMDIYRVLDMADAVRDDYVGYNWNTGYTTDGKAQWKNTTLAYNSAESRWSTDWFWESNQHYYHIRTLSPISQVVTEDTSKGDYTTITSASCNSEANYNQAAWGAPFADVDPSYKFTYDPTSGFDGIYANAETPYHQIYKAIGPTLDQIKVLMFHMYSGVHFTIKTTNGNDKVELFDGTNRTRVDLVAYYPEGKVRLGTCAVDASGTLSTAAVPYNVSFASATDAGHYTNQEYFLSAVPQDLTNIKLHITTPDHNLYIVDLADVIVTGDPNYSTTNMGFDYTQVETNKYKIDRWYPNVKYNYSFTLKKTGITNLSATIVQWENVTADDETVQIK